MSSRSTSTYHTCTSALPRDSSFCSRVVTRALMHLHLHIGGGTKTRRPITLHMKYNSIAVQPTCFLLTEDCGEQEVSLEELQVRRAADCGFPACCSTRRALYVHLLQPEQRVIIWLPEMYQCV